MCVRMFGTFVFIYFCVLHSAYSVSIVAASECIYIDYLGKSFNITEVGCPLNDVCNPQRELNVTYIEMPLYYNSYMKNNENKSNLNLQKPVHRLLRRCCGTCTRINQLETLKNVGELGPVSLENSDFIYPVFARASKKKMLGFYYIPFITIPGITLAAEAPKGSLLSLLSEGRFCLFTIVPSVSYQYLQKI